MIPRIPIKYLKFSAAGLVALMLSEGFSLTAIMPTLGDVWTYGFGLTWREDGTPVQKGDTITPPKAVQRSHAHIARDETGLKRCVTADLTQNEYDTLVDFSYQYGMPKTCASKIVSHFNAGRYTEACQSYLLYKYSGGYDCSTLIDGKPNKRCWGVWTRNVERTKRCLG